MQSGEKNTSIRSTHLQEFKIEHSSMDTSKCEVGCENDDLNGPLCAGVNCCAAIALNLKR